MVWVMGHLNNGSRGSQNVTHCQHSALLALVSCVTNIHDKNLSNPVA